LGISVLRARFYGDLRAVRWYSLLPSAFWAVFEDNTIAPGKKYHRTLKAVNKRERFCVRFSASTAIGAQIVLFLFTALSVSDYSRAASGFCDVTQ